MFERTFVFSILILLTTATMISGFVFAILAVLGSAEGPWFLLSGLSLLSTGLLVWQLKTRLQLRQKHQQLIQSYVDRLLFAKSPEERQPLLEEMSSRRLLKGIRLSSSDLEDLDLSFADFSHADLRGATLSGANLTGANLTGATLSYATLAYITLTGATLKDANLRGVNLRGGDLRQANLSGAVMRGATLACAALNGTVLRNAQLQDANLQDADLSNAELQGADFTRAIMPNGEIWDGCLDIDCFANPDDAGIWKVSNSEWPTSTTRRQQ